MELFSVKSKLSNAPQRLLHCLFQRHPTPLILQNDELIFAQVPASEVDVAVELGPVERGIRKMPAE
jgi:hypothetical protein